MNAPILNDHISESAVASNSAKAFDLANSLANVLLTAETDSYPEVDDALDYPADDSVDTTQDDDYESLGDQVIELVLNVNGDGYSEEQATEFESELSGVLAEAQSAGTLYLEHLLDLNPASANGEGDDAADEAFDRAVNLTAHVIYGYLCSELFGTDYDDGEGEQDAALEDQNFH